MARFSIALRRQVRLVREQPPVMRGLAAATALVLVAALGTVASRVGGHDEQRVTAANGQNPDGSPSTDGSVGTPGASGKGKTAKPKPGSTSKPGAVITPGTPGSTTPGSGPTTPGVVTGPGVPTPTYTAVPGPKPTQPCTHKATDQGVTGSSVKVVFPYFDLTAVLNITGGSDETLENAKDAINAYVSEINAQGGIYCRKIDPIVTEFNPLNEADMDAKCRQWAEDDKVFAVVDSDAWHSTHQLCLTQDHHIPLLTGLGLASEWTKRGAPYLWWASPTAEQTVDNWALWSKAHGHLGSHKVGVIVSDKEEEKIGGARMVADLKRLGVAKPIYHVVPFDAAQAQPFIARAINDMSINGVDRLFMMLPFTTFATFLQAAESQDFYPKYMLSDYQSGLVTAEAVLGLQYAKSLEGAEGPSYIRLAVDEDPTLSNYAPAEKRCSAIWKKHTKPETPPAYHGGIAMRWCDHISQFALGLNLAGPNPTRANWAQAMASIKAYPAAMSPTFTWGPGDYAGADLVSAYRVHTSVGPGKCTEKAANGDNTCHASLEPFGRFRVF
jgi:ABC-type branched-subunit amino acid transport system substrate-binding protein